MMRPRPGSGLYPKAEGGGWFLGKRWQAQTSSGSVLAREQAALADDFQPAVSGHFPGARGRRGAAGRSWLRALGSAQSLCPDQGWSEGTNGHCQSLSSGPPPLTYPPLQPPVLGITEDVPSVELAHPALQLQGEGGILKTSSAKPKYALGKVSVASGQVWGSEGACDPLCSSLQGSRCPGEFIVPPGHPTASSPLGDEVRDSARRLPVGKPQHFWGAQLVRGGG